MKQHCEKCGARTNLTDSAYICSFECTFCVDCTKLMNSICPNCSGVLVLRPTRNESPTQTVLTIMKYRLTNRLRNSKNK
ncbi:MAG: DUF1272 domain-containing protein [Armatimonadota bacterium]